MLACATCAALALIAALPAAAAGAGAGDVRGRARRAARRDPRVPAREPRDPDRDDRDPGGAPERRRPPSRTRPWSPTHADAIFDDGFSFVGGNPEGGVTVVEFLDYQCGFCRRAHPDVAELIASDGDIRWIVKELPILGPGSELAARAAVATLIAEGPERYAALNDRLMRLEGQVDDASLDGALTETGARPGGDPRRHGRRPRSPAGWRRPARSPRSWRSPARRPSSSTTGWCAATCRSRRCAALVDELRATN